MTVGTDHHPFDRLLRWAASWPGDGPVLAQSGTAAVPAGLDARPTMAADELQAAMRDAVAVVCHGGPATILEARHAGHLPIVVPRRADRGEHVDDHQGRFAAWMARRGQIALATSEAELHAHLDRAVADPGAYRVETDGGRQAEVSTRFGDLVEALVRYRPR